MYNDLSAKSECMILCSSRSGFLPILKQGLSACYTKSARIKSHTTPGGVK
jgi:hypothetical protein